MSSVTIVTNYDAALSAQLTKNGATFNIPVTATVKARLVSVDRKHTYTDAVTQSSASAGADWSTSRVTILFSNTDLANISYQGLAICELQIDDAGNLDPFFDEVTIVKGTIK